MKWREHETRTDGAYDRVDALLPRRPDFGMAVPTGRIRRPDRHHRDRRGAADLAAFLRRAADDGPSATLSLPPCFRRTTFYKAPHNHNPAAGLRTPIQLAIALDICPRRAQHGERRRQEEY